MSLKAAPSKEFRARWNAGIDLIQDGEDPWLVLERVCWPSEDIEKASAGELPPGWFWTTEGKREKDKLERQRARYWERKAR